MRTILFILGLALLSSCEGDYTIHYEWQGMTAYNANNSTDYPEIDNSDSIPASIYSIKLKMNTVETFRKGRYLDTETPPRNMTPLDSLIITSNVDFNASHPAGTNLTKYFRILNGNYFNSLPADGSEGYFITNIYSDHFYDTPNVEEIDLLLMEAPETVNVHAFTINFILGDGTVFAQTLTPVTLH